MSELFVVKGIQKYEDMAGAIVDAMTDPLPIEWQTVIKSLEAGEVPESFPDAIAMDDYGNIFSDKPIDFGATSRTLRIKGYINDLGMFGYYSKKGAEYLANRYKGKTIIDPMAGAGWFAKAMREQGFKVIAGDLNADKIRTVTDVIPADCEALVKEFGEEADVLFFNWAMFDDPSDLRAALEWGGDKPIVVYGELGGCCNSDEFYDAFTITEELSDFPDLNCAVLRRLRFCEGTIATNNGEFEA
ncbi:hypothetical protein [Vibrio crassostreae]|uniref:hypothetical protein n=1 Tax=Vibrio crassostreae TaxID=246167 RepID=UPI001B30D61E|nr:hypothetical protein [Vibrio crassostreae]